MTKSGSLNGELAKWALLLLLYNIHFIPQKSVKGQAIADFLAEYPIPENPKLHEDILDEAAEVNLFEKQA